MSESGDLKVQNSGPIPSYSSKMMDVEVIARGATPSEKLSLLSGKLP
jgi:hypothetical protein